MMPQQYISPISPANFAASALPTDDSAAINVIAKQQQPTRSGILYCACAAFCLLGLGVCALVAPTTAVASAKTISTKTSAQATIFSASTVVSFNAPPAPVTTYQQLSFRTLRTYLPGKKPPQEVIEMNGKSVEVMGFMAALTQLEEIDEFVLASSPPMNCFCHPPLRVNEVIFVQMKKGKKIEYKGGVVRVRGRLTVNTNVTDEFADIMYTIECEEVL